MKLIKIILFALIWLLLNYAVFIHIPTLFDNKSATQTELNRIILNRKTFLIILIVFGVYLYIKNHMYIYRINIKIFTFSLLMSVSIFYLFELYFTFNTKSHAIGYSYAGRLWMMRFWNPVNKLNFRDIEFQHNTLKKSIYFIGDSFTAGHGIKNATDRYSDIIRNKKTDFEVYNLGINGIGTQKELAILKSVAVDNATVIWQYCPNDIDELLPKYGYHFEFTPYNDISGFIKQIVKGSFFANYLYWSMPHNDAIAYQKSLESALKNKPLADEHLKDCEQIINYCSANSIRLFVVVFPYFFADDTNIFNQQAEMMTNFLKAKNIPVVDVDSLTKDMKTIDKVVNNFDPHANETVHRRISKYLIPLL